jgi:hypothetical protein
MWRLVLVCMAISALAAGCSTELRHESGPNVTVSVTKAGDGDLVAHVSSENWPSCANTLRVLLDGSEALSKVPVSDGRFGFDLHVSDGAALAIQSTCKESGTALNDWSTVIHGP